MDNNLNEKFDHSLIEKAVRESWEKENLYKTAELKEGEEKFYSLYSFPYPSGSGLHVGHAEGMVANDIMARFHRMNGEKATLPMGWDSFGLPAENYAIKTGVHPDVSTEEAVKTFIEQIKRLGIGVDWEKEVGAHRPDYYKWTQWFFTELYKHGLTYKAFSPVNWCPKDQTVLANEQVVDGKCERCDTPVEKKDMEQWFFKITDYAERLIKDLDDVDWPDATKHQQRNWIGKSSGSEIKFPLSLDTNKVLVASGNKSKVERIKKLVKNAGLNFEILSLEEASVDKIEVEEDGDLEDNAKKKAFAYLGKVDYPILAIDTALYIENEEMKPEWLKRNALGDKNEKDLSQKEIAEEMQKYYMQIAKSHGGNVDGYFLDAFTLVNPDGTSKSSVSRRDVTITDTPNGEIDIYFPLNSIYKAQPVNKYFSDIKDTEEEINWLTNVTTSLKEVLTSNLEIFTTRTDTLFGVTFMVVAPEHKIIEELKYSIKNIQEIEEYVQKAKNKTDLQRTDLNKDKTGIVIKGMKAINPINNKEIPIFVADYVLMNYGTGAIMAVPAHDERDYEFAKKNNLEILDVIEKPEGFGDKVYSQGGKLINSEEYSSLNSEDAKEKIVDFLKEKDLAKKSINYKLRDWLISRQRYWGAPIPAIWREREKADKVSLVHGLGATASELWLPWLKESLSNQNIEVIAENFPDTNTPQLKKWISVLESQQLTENSSIVGHSSGGFAALKYAESHKVKQLILVAPANTGSHGHWKKFEDEIPVDFLEKHFYFEELDPEKIAQNVQEIVLIFSNDDPYINSEIQNQFLNQFCKYENIEIRTFFNKHHFSRAVNCKEIPELLQYFGEKQYRVLKTADLPLMLPKDVDFIPKGYSPLSRSKEYTDNIRKKYGKEWTPEYDTMDTFVCSSWYFFRFVDPKNSESFANSELLNKWLPVDLYMIGTEHIVLHLMYARFFTKFLFDLGKIKFNEPFQKMRHMGIIAGPDGRKMSKRWGNVINPTDVVDMYGADTLRIYEMFMGPLDQGKAWSDSSVQGVRRFLDRIWRLSNLKIENTLSDEAILIELNDLIKKITVDTNELKFNTAIAAFMKFLNFIEKKEISIDVLEKFILVLSPYAPYLTEHIWKNILGHENSIHLETWPKFNENLLLKKVISLPVQINGKTRGKIDMDPECKEEEIIEKIKSVDSMNKYLQGGIKKVIYIKGRIVNIIS